MLRSPKSQLQYLNPIFSLAQYVFSLLCATYESNQKLSAGIPLQQVTHLLIRIVEEIYLTHSLIKINTPDNVSFIAVNTS